MNDSSVVVICFSEGKVLCLDEGSEGSPVLRTGVEGRKFVELGDFCCG